MTKCHRKGSRNNRVGKWYGGYKKTKWKTQNLY